MADKEIDVFDELQKKIVKLAESKKEDFLEILQDTYGDNPKTIFTACRFAHNIYSEGNMPEEEFNKVWGDCKSYFSDKGDSANLLELEKLMAGLEKQNKQKEGT